MCTVYVHGPVISCQVRRQAGRCVSVNDSERESEHMGLPLYVCEGACTRVCECVCVVGGIGVDLRAPLSL